MAHPWENVTWQSRDGSWSRGYFARLRRRDHPGEDNDFDQNDEFDRSSFDYLISGCSTDDEAYGYTPMGNPGSSEVYPYSSNSKLCEHFDSIAALHVSNFW